MDQETFCSERCLGSKLWTDHKTPWRFCDYKWNATRDKTRKSYSNKYMPKIRDLFHFVWTFYVLPTRPLKAAVDY